MSKGTSETTAEAVAETAGTADAVEVPEAAEESAPEETPEEETTEPGTVVVEEAPAEETPSSTEEAPAAPADATEAVVIAEENGRVRAVSTAVRLEVAKFRTAFLDGGSRDAYLESVRKANKFYGSSTDANDVEALMSAGERIVLENVIPL